MKSKSVDLIEGSIAKGLFWFSVPLLIGNLFQQLYNTFDSYVVGNYVSKQALAAVGASSPIINALIGFFMGLATGAGVVIAQYYGAKDKDNLKDSVHSAAALTIVMSIILTAVGLAGTKPLLHLISIPKDVFPESAEYLSIYFAGLTFVLIYNMGAGVLRAIGDSKRPLYFLMVTSVLNIVLDYLFVKYFKMGVAGAGWATLISQAVSSFMVLYCLIHTNDIYKLEVTKIRFHFSILKRIIFIGLPAGLQTSIISLSNVIVQSYINVFGSSVLAGYSAAVRIDGFLNLPMQSLSMAITTFVGQNIGAEKLERVRKGVRTCMIMTCVIIGSLSIILLIFGKPMIAIFNSDKDVIAAGRTLQFAFIPFYIFLPFCHITAGALRGAGKSSVPMYILIGCFVVTRQIYLFISTKFIHSLYFVFMGWPFTWILCAILMMIYYYKVDWLHENK